MSDYHYYYKNKFDLAAEKAGYDDTKEFLKDMLEKHGNKDEVGRLCGYKSDGAAFFIREMSRKKKRVVINKDKLRKFIYENINKYTQAEMKRITGVGSFVINQLCRELKKEEKKGDFKKAFNKIKSDILCKKWVQ